MTNSVVLALIGSILNSNMQSLIRYIVEKHVIPRKLEKIGYVQTFRQLISSYNSLVALPLATGKNLAQGLPQRSSQSDFPSSSFDDSKETGSTNNVTHVQSTSNFVQGSKISEKNDGKPILQNGSAGVDLPSRICESSVSESSGAVESSNAGEVECEPDTSGFSAESSSVGQAGSISTSNYLYASSLQENSEKLPSSASSDLKRAASTDSEQSLAKRQKHEADRPE